MKKTLLAVIILLSTLTACVKEYKLPEHAFDIITYKGNETLVFESDTKDTDTLYLKGEQRQFVSIGDGLLPYPDKAERYKINYISSKPNDLRKLISIDLYGTDSYIVDFDIATKNATCFGRFLFTESKFHSIPSINLEINGTHYNDVKIIVCQDIQSEYYTSINKVYWSVSTGLLGWDVNNQIWRLKK